MKKTSFKSPDDLILGIRTIMSENRCSFSVEEQALLEDCITRLEEIKTKPPTDPQVKLDKIQVLTILMRVFVTAKHLFSLFLN